MGALRFTHRAREDMIDIWCSIAPHNPEAADRIFDHIETSCLRLRDHRELGVARPEIGEGARALIVDRWIAFYRLTEGGAQIVRVVDGARDLTQLDWAPEE